MEDNSFRSVYIRTFFNDKSLMNGTGFFIAINNTAYLITNRHNVTGRGQTDNQPLHPSCGVPNNIKIYCHDKNNPGKNWIIKTEQLYLNDGETPRWIEHPIFKEKVDVVALKITENEDSKNITVYPYVPSDMLNQIKLQPSESVSILGFPFGENAGENKEQMFPIWVNGFIASEPEININGLPLFYVDCRSREGQSGSPVIAFRNGIITTKNNGIVTVNNYSEILGVYSGRINKESDIGKVWKISVVQEIMQHIQQKQSNYLWNPIVINAYPTYLTKYIEK